MKKLSCIALTLSFVFTTAYADTPGTVKWSFNIQDKVVAAPAVAADGTIYAPSASQFLWAINPNGTKKWAAYVQYPITGSPAAAQDGSIFLSTDTATQSLLYKISPTGAIVWSVETSNPPTPGYCPGSQGIDFKLIGAPAISGNTVIINGWTEAGSLCYSSNAPTAIDRLTDSNRWIKSNFPMPVIYTAEMLLYVDSNTGNQTLEALIFTALTNVSPLPPVPLSWLRTPVIDQANSITATTANNADIYSNLSSPQLMIGNYATKAQYHPGIPAGDTSKLTSPIGGGNGVLYVGDTKGNLFKYDEAGNLLMTIHLHGDLTGAAPVMGSNGVTYVGSDDGNIYAVDPDGTWDWSTFLNSGGVSQPVAINPTTGVIYVTTTIGYVYALDSQGNILWSQDNVQATTAPTLGPDGTVYVGTYNNSIVAIGG